MGAAMKKIVVGVSGATGTILAYKLVDFLTRRENQVHLVMSGAARQTAQYEMGDAYGSAVLWKKKLPVSQQAFLHCHSIHDIGSPIASGTFPIDAMAVVPCSVATVGALAAGLADNLIRRAADVTIKERRPLVLMVRETPLSPIHLENLLKLSRCGVTISMPVPAWYHRPTSLADVEDHLVGRLLAALGVQNELEQSWKGLYPPPSKLEEGSEK